MENEQEDNSVTKAAEKVGGNFCIPNMRSGKDMHTHIVMFKDFLSILSNAMQTDDKARKDGGKV